MFSYIFGLTLSSLDISNISEQRIKLTDADNLRSFTLISLNWTVFGEAVFRIIKLTTKLVHTYWLVSIVSATLLNKEYYFKKNKWTLFINNELAVHIVRRRKSNLKKMNFNEMFASKKVSQKLSSNALVSASNTKQPSSLNPPA